MENNSHPTFGNGKICYVELPASDISVSVAFYKEVFGWQIREHNDGRIAFDDGVGEVSGTWVTDRKPATEIGLMVHIMVNNVADTIELIIKKRGKIVQPPGKDFPEITARFSDPGGNILGLYQHSS